MMEMQALAGEYYPAGLQGVHPPVRILWYFWDRTHIFQLVMLWSLRLLTQSMAFVFSGQEIEMFSLILQNFEVKSSLVFFLSYQI